MDELFYVVLDGRGRFLSGPTGLAFVAEFPDATQYGSLGSARNWALRALHKLHGCGPLKVVRDYGLETQETVAELA